MIKPRPFGTFADAIAEIVERVGWQTVCAALEIGRSQTYRWADPDARDLPSVRHAAQLDALAKRHGLGTPIADIYGRLVAELTGAAPAHVPADPLDRITSVVQEVGEALGAFRACIVVNPTPVQIDDALREIAEAQHELELTAQDLEARRDRRLRAVTA